MKKIVMVSLLVGGMIVLNWCAKKYTTEVSFDQFTFKVTTQNMALVGITEEEKVIFENEENLYRVYTIMNKGWYSDSLLISKEQISTEIPLDRLVQLNIKKLETRLQWFKASASSQIDVKCWKDTMTWHLQSFTFDGATPKEKIYMNQYFFKDQGYLYIISSSTEDSTNNKGFKTWIKNIQCPK